MEEMVFDNVDIKPLEVLRSALIPLKNLRSNTGQVPGLPPNPRSIDMVQLQRLKKSIAENPEMLSLYEIKVFPYKGKFVVIGGNQRLLALRGGKYKEVPCKLIPEDSTPEQLRAYLIKENLEFGEYVDEMLSRDWNLNELDDFGMDDVQRLDSITEHPLPEHPAEQPVNEAPVEEEQDDPNNPVRPIEVPTYEPKGKDVSLCELVNTERTDELIAVIDESDMPDDVKQFLTVAAHRHSVFDYHKIAEFYVGASADVQHLMEKSGLVIIDDNDAIRGGYLKLIEQFRQQYKEDDPR